ncbi:unnamed protein product [Bursaphelenchus xylophilus]|nr:unnamed protein product [Bursaphelenchus xylophilus]CAG9089759.1 unnamed protein product [Bursaphelenchus xylophilus]
MISNLVIFIRAFVYIEYCTNVYPFWLGALLKWPLTWTTTTLTMLHFFICIERIMARMYKDDYERKGRGFGMTAVLVAWLVTILINYELCKPPSFTYRMPYCDSQIMKDQPKAAYVSMVLFGIEMITTFSDLMLQYFNKKSAQIIFDRYSLSRSYQIRENYFTSRLVFPVACAHSALYVLYLLCSFIAKNLQAINEDKVFSRSLVISIHNFAILSCTVSMLVYCNRLEAFGKQRELCETAYSNAIATKLYFNQLELQFDEAHSNKPKQSRMGISPTRSI